MADRTAADLIRASIAALPCTRTAREPWNVNQPPCAGWTAPEAEPSLTGDGRRDGTIMCRTGCYVAQTTGAYGYGPTAAHIALLASPPVAQALAELLDAANALTRIAILNGPLRGLPLQLDEATQALETALLAQAKESG